MPAAKPRRTLVVLALSGAAHLAVLLWLIQQRPSLHVAVEPATFEVTIAPRFLTTKAPPPRPRPVAARIEPLRPHRAIRRETETDVTPLPLPGLPAAPPADLNAAILPGGPRDQARAALRGGSPGCANAAAVGLTPEERERCFARLGAGAQTAPYLGLGLSRDKQRLLDAAAARQEAYRRYRDGPMPPGLSHSDAPGLLTGLGDTGHAPKGR